MQILCRNPSRQCLTFLMLNDNLFPRISRPRSNLGPIIAGFPPIYSCFFLRKEKGNFLYQQETNYRKWSNTPCMLGLWPKRMRASFYPPFESAGIKMSRAANENNGKPLNDLFVTCCDLTSRCQCEFGSQMSIMYHSVQNKSFTLVNSKLQWQIVNAIFELPSVHTGEKTSPILRFSIPERREEAWLVSVFFWQADCYFIRDRNFY